MTLESEELSIRGSLSESSLPELLASISRSKETGILNFHDAGRWKAIYFKEGRIIYAMSNAQDDRLGEFLLKSGKITVRQLLEASKLIQHDKKLGAVLVDQSIITPDDLFVAIHRHAEAIVYSLFEWTRGEYEFVIKDLSAEGPMVLDLDSGNVVLEGIRRLNDFTRIYAGVGPLESVLRPADSSEGQVHRINLDEDESQVLSLVNGRLSVEQILAMSYLPNFETLRILFALVAAGVLERGGTDESEKRGIELEYELQEIVDHHNRNFEGVCAFIREKIDPEQALVFTEDVMRDVAKQFPLLFEGIELGTAGRVDFDQLLQNLGDRPHEAKKAVLIDGLNELMYGLLLEIGRRFGKASQEVVATSVLSHAQPSFPVT
ncbi:MAG TPA: DUF4388 domain-containing protein [Vicinamibacteria bacterium]|nr:DUF4388 domain-containing protein [Vicinamibacteria bacterium]